MKSLNLKNIRKSYDQTEIVKGINLEVSPKEFIVFVGPSGCGKSTLLRMIAGLEEVSEGQIFIGNEDITYSEPSDRGVAMVFQDYALYPHMSVFENMAFGLRLKKIKENEISERVEKAATILGLGPYLERKPAQLSGGQRQRVAMGRAFVKNTGLYLFDEPLSNLDAKLRNKMRQEIKKFHKATGGTIIYVTHDQLEAMTLADKIVVLSNGMIQQMGSPLEVFDFPHSKFVASFIGSPAMNFLEGEITEGNTSIKIGEHVLKLPEGKYQRVSDGMRVYLGVRPSDLFILEGEEFKKWCIPADVEFIEPLGKNAFITFKKGDIELIGEVMGRVLPEVGEKVEVALNLNHAHLFDFETERNLLLS